MTFELPAQAPASAHFVDLSDVRLWVRDTGGDGAPVVFCHPASQCSRIWIYQQPVFAAVGHRVISYDRRGHGCSNKGRAGTHGASVADLVALLDALSVSDAHIVGAAAGGIGALAFAVDQPARVRSLTLSGTIFSLAEDNWRKAYARLGIEAVRDHLPIDFVELGPSYRFTQPEGAAHFARLSAVALRQSPPRQPSGVAVTWEKLRRLDRPVLFLTGEADLYAPPPLQEMIAAHVPGAECHNLAEVGHAAYWESPDIFNRLVLDFVKRADGDDAPLSA